MSIRNASISMLAISGILAMSACTSTPATEVRGVKNVAPIPTVTVSVPALPLISTPAPTAVASPIADTPIAVPRAQAPATYRLVGTCIDTYKGAESTSAARVLDPINVAAGKTLRYEFHFKRQENRSYTKACTFKTERRTQGSEPRLSITIGCTGEATYSAKPTQPTSAIAKTFYEPADLQDGFTHTMTGPKSPEHLTEDVVCDLKVVRR